MSIVYSHLHTHRHTHTCIPIIHIVSSGGIVCGHCVIDKCEIEFNMRFSVLGKIFERTLIAKSCLALEKKWLMCFGSKRSEC